MMNHTKIGAVLVAWLIIVVGICVISSGARAADIDQMVASAKTAADHEAIAAYYDHAATEAEKQAKEHETLKETYEKKHAYRSEQNFGGKKPSWHCGLAAKYYEDVATEDRTLAQGHRQMAKALGQ